MSIYFELRPKKSHPLSFLEFYSNSWYEQIFMKDLSIHIATLNGTGSLSANQILTRILFRSGYLLSSYNFFPSNIAGLPCTYSLRLSSEGFTAYEPFGDILINLNPKTLSKNIKELKPKGFFVTDEHNKTDISFEGQWLSLPLTKSLPESVPYD